MVKEEGNTRAKEVVNHIFEIGDQEWRGMGIIPNSGMVMKEQFWMFDASRKFDIETSQPKLQSNCIVGEILRGLKKPFECPEFAKGCNPTHPHGAPMVSSEGACAAYYHYSR